MTTFSDISKYEASFFIELEIKLHSSIFVTWLKKKKVKESQSATVSVRKTKILF